jgi:hypothetical protein
LRFLIQALWDVALFELTKGDIQQGIIAYSLRKTQSESNGILCTKIGKMCFRYQTLTTAFQMQ